MSEDTRRLLDRALYHAGSETLVLSDLHVGREQTSAVELPIGARADLRERLAALLDAVAPDTVVLAGDVLHSFDRVPTGVSGTLDGLLEAIEDRDASPVVLEGNHDTMLATVLDGSVQTAHRLDGETVVVHGHREPTIEATRYVIGHEHPTIEIEGVRHPCLLECRDQYEGAAVTVLPAFTRLARGVAVNRLAADESASPLLTNVDRCRPTVRPNEETVTFPPLGEFRSML
ncbi:MAG: metallophosphoesterase [Halanaeroarchaeum sp.]